MNHDPRFTRFANGLSFAVLIVAVLACGYAFGKRISSAEAAVGQRSGDTGAIQGATVTGDVVLKDSQVAGDADLLEFNATAYCMAGYTAAGIVAHKGTIAADPRILPLGSVVHIRAGEYSGTYLVLDTGAKIRGRKIDIYIPDRREAMSFGKRPVRLKVIGRVHPSHLQPK